MTHSKYYTTDTTGGPGTFVDIHMPTVPDINYFPTFDPNDWFINPMPSIADFSDVLNWARNLLDLHGFDMPESVFIRDLGTCANFVQRNFGAKFSLSIEDCLEIRNYLILLINKDTPEYLENLILPNIKIGKESLSLIESNLSAKILYCKRKMRYIKS